MLCGALPFILLLPVLNAVNLLDIPRDFDINNEDLSIIADNIAEQLHNELLSQAGKGIETRTFKLLTAQLPTSRDGRSHFIKDLHKLAKPEKFVLCTTCRAVVKVITNTFRNDNDTDRFDVAEKTEFARTLIMHTCRQLSIQTEEVCSALFDINWPLVEYIIRHSTTDSRTICSLFMQLSFCNTIDQTKYNWTLSIDNGNRMTNESKSNLPSGGVDDVRVLHLTDIHYDPWYEAGSLAECDEPLCCQRHKNKLNGTKQAAGYWGDYRNCDLPWQTYDQALLHIKETHPNIDYIFQTGDVIDHMIWETSVEKNKEVYTRVTQRLYELFPNTPVYPCIGNHEPHPLNLFSPDYVPTNVSTHWLYEYLYDLWSKWLPPDTKPTILKGGYYTVLVKPGYRIIALNNNECYMHNYWLFYNGTDLKTQLIWLHDTLLSAEKAGEYVHILAHIPSGDSTCWNVWSREYNRIIERFHNTVSGIFNGHTHVDEMNLHYSSSGHAVAIAFNGGSLTPWTFKNPNYRIYQMEPQRMQVVDHETWIFNLTAANLAGRYQNPIWIQEYRFAKEFSDDLSPAGIDKLIVEMADNPELLLKFWRYKVTLADPMLEQGCDKACLLETICWLATTVSDQTKRCEELKSRLSIAVRNDTTPYTFQFDSVELQAKLLYLEIFDIYRIM